MSKRVKPDAVAEVTEAILSEVMAQGVTPQRETWERYARAAVGVFLRVIDEEIDKWETVESDGWQSHRWDDATAALDALRPLRARFEEADDE